MTWVVEAATDASLERAFLRLVQVSADAEQSQGQFILIGEHVLALLEFRSITRKPYTFRRLVEELHSHGVKELGHAFGKQYRVNRYALWDLANLARVFGRNGLLFQNVSHDKDTMQHVAAGLAALGLDRPGVRATRVRLLLESRTIKPRDVRRLVWNVGRLSIEKVKASKNGKPFDRQLRTKLDALHATAERMFSGTSGVSSRPTSRDKAVGGNS